MPATTSIMGDEYMAQPVPSTVKCPACASGTVARITGGEKLVKGMSFGLLAASTLSKTFKCSACGYKW